MRAACILQRETHVVAVTAAAVTVTRVAEEKGKRNDASWPDDLVCECLDTYYYSPSTA
jgi:hypothetical protein